MAVFVQGHHQHQHGSVVRLMIVRAREAVPCFEVTPTRLVVSRVCGPIALDTPVPLDTVETPRVWWWVQLHPRWFRKESASLSGVMSNECWEGAKSLQTLHSWCRNVNASDHDFCNKNVTVVFVIDFHLCTLQNNPSQTNLNCDMINCWPRLFQKHQWSTKLCGGIGSYRVMIHGE